MKLAELMKYLLIFIILLLCATSVFSQIERPKDQKYPVYNLDTADIESLLQMIEAQSGPEILIKSIEVENFQAHIKTIQPTGLYTCTIDTVISQQSLFVTEFAKAEMPADKDLKYGLSITDMREVLKKCEKDKQVAACCINKIIGVESGVLVGTDGMFFLFYQKNGNGKWHVEHISL